MLTDETKVMVKFWCGVQPRTISNLIGRSECFVSNVITRNVVTKQPEYVQERKLFSGNHYANLCWLRLYLDEILKDRKPADIQGILD